MVSFCDIPISDYKKHFFRRTKNKLGYYGDYGIGLTKEWAVRNGLNPVIYIDSNSHVGTALRKSIELFSNLSSPKFNQSELKISINNKLDQFALYSKNYQGPLYRKGELKLKKYCFYDEREWRFVPYTETEIGGNKVILNDTEYQNNIYDFKEKLNDYYLNFEWKDVAYIIVKNAEFNLQMQLNPGS